ncbi:endo-1,4-beta-xylanase [Prevotella sp. P5-92]|uniref:endo-1,4-beta-xylanase n=1 Tax=Prevotella sp. P5-92 TaxID=2024222 RepID=UPI0013034648|nr:endo-1,4-beta-xylanase [Prevotella sp. P5-92]
MKKNIINGLLMLATGVFAVSCADYNVTDDFTAEPDPTITEPYKDLAPVKSYIDRSKNPNMSLGVTLKVTDYNKQALAHAAAMTNFDNLAFGTSLMSGKIVNAKGVMNFLDMKDLLDHVEEIGGDVFGSPIVANANQADEWLNTLTAPIEIAVDPIQDKYVDYTTMETFTGTAKKGKPSIVKNYDGTENALKLPKRSKVYIVEDFDIDLLGTYTVTFYAKVDKDETVVCTFSDNKIQEGKGDKLYELKKGKWVKVVVEATPAEGATAGYLMVEGNLNSDVYIKNVSVVHTPDNHRPQTAQELNDTLNYALNAWCDGLMKINAGRIKSFDLIDEALDTKAELENGMLDLKHSTEKIFWQDVFGSENYAKAVSDAAIKAFTNRNGDPAQLKFFISETGLADQKRFESLKYWIGVWDAKGAKIDGINAKLNLSYSEDAATQAETVAAFDKLLENLVSTGKLIRLSNFDITYKDATGANVSAKDITEEQRQKLADFYAYVIKSYMSKIPSDKQAGLCKGNMVDTSDPVGLWSVDSNSKDWVRTATYKAFCDALSGN